MGTAFVSLPCEPSVATLLTLFIWQIWPSSGDGNPSCWCFGCPNFDFDCSKLLTFGHISHAAAYFSTFLGNVHSFVCIFGITSFLGLEASLIHGEVVYLMTKGRWFFLQLVLWWEAWAGRQLRMLGWNAYLSNLLLDMQRCFMMFSFADINYRILIIRYN